MKILDRNVIEAAFTRWALVLLLGIFLIFIGDFIGKMGDYIGAIAHGRSLFLIEFYLYRFPEFMTIWLPLSTAVAGLLTAAPMLRQGTLVALAAAGIAPRRVFTGMLLLAVAVGALGFVLKDQVNPRLARLAELSRQRMVGSLKADEERARSVGWQEGDHFWAVMQAWPDVGEYRQVGVFGADGARTESTMLLAERLFWRDDAWRLAEAVVVHSSTIDRHQECTVAEAGIALTPDPDQLAVLLKSDNDKTSSELLASHANKAWGKINLRISFALLAPLCLLFALPGFIRFDRRGNIATLIISSLGYTLIPIVAHGLLVRLLVSSTVNAAVLSVVVIVALFMVGAWRWWRMRL
ncbi:MAG: LptF/LptG family permease [Planctomycetes bacterium]|nr:LptF/LptG family permease [Planctomycetota bacterium]